MLNNYSLWNAGLNYRDKKIAINELNDGYNLYWEGNLKRRKGYEQRNADLVSPDPTNWPSSGLEIIDQIRLKNPGSDQHFLFVKLLDTAGTTNAITMFHTSGLPDSTNSSYRFASTSTHTTDGAGEIIPWEDSDPLSITVMDDKIWFALGDNNPYVTYYDIVTTGFVIHEYPLCQLSNNGATGSTSGKNIIPGSTDATDIGDWAGSNVVAAGGGYVYVSDGKTLYWGISDAGVRADNGATYNAILDRTSGVHTADCPDKPGWDVAQFLGLEEKLDLNKATMYKKYLYMYSEKALFSLYLRDLYAEDLEKVIESRIGVRGKVITCEAGIFYVGKDGIYGFDGNSAFNLGKKIWPDIENEHSTMPGDLDNCNIGYHGGKIWVSFPDGTNKDIYVGDPDLIYSDSLGDDHLPFYKFRYTNTTGRTAFGFENLIEYDNRLYGINDKHIYELDVEGLDDNTTSSGIGINIYSKSFYDDLETPNIGKAFRQVVLETDEGLSNNTTADIIDLRMGFSVDYSTDVKFRAITDTGEIETEVSTGGGHASVTIDVPFTTAGYVLDGNSMSIEILGETSGCGVTGDVNIYGYDLNYVLKARPNEEID